MKGSRTLQAPGIVDPGRHRISGYVLCRFDDGASEAFQAGRIRAGAADVSFVSEYLPLLRPGVMGSLSGFWEHHPEHGRQFRVVQLDSAQLPNTANAVERLLLDVPGFGPAYARRIVAMRGPSVLEELARDSSILTKVLPGKRGRTLQAGWDRWVRTWTDHQDGMEFATSLIGLGCTSFEARRVLEYFRSSSTARIVVLRHPFRLLEVPGLSWKKVDRVGKRLGIQPTEPERLIAAASRAARDLMESGHSAATPDSLCEQIGRLVGSPGLGTQAIKLAEEAGELVDDEVIYLPEALQAEWTVASQLRRLARRTNVLTAQQEATLRAHLHTTPLNAEQRTAVENACRCGVSILTGGPGTGKTTATKEIVRAVHLLGKTVSILAPTGRAAIRSCEVTGAPAATIHKAIGGPPGSTRETPIRDDLVVVEECSMVSIETMAWLLQNISSRTRLVLVGDADQLPSVEHGAVLRDILRSAMLPAVQLEAVYRQGEESGIIVAARRVLEGQHLDGVDGPGFYWADTGERDEESVARRVLDAVTWLASKWPTQGIQVLSPMKRGALGTVRLNVHLQELLNPNGLVGPRVGGNVAVRVGDRVIQTRNDYSLGTAGIMNGQQGSVLDTGPGRILVAFDDETLWVDGYNLYNLRLAWAVTIHKSQGSEWPHVVVVAHPSHAGLLDRQILYTALTRARQTAVLVANRQALALALRTDAKASRCTGLPRHMEIHNG